MYVSVTLHYKYTMSMTMEIGRVNSGFTTKTLVYRYEINMVNKLNV